MAGKKARCKKCNTPFRIPGGTGDAIAPTATANPAEDDIPSAMPVEDDEPLAAVVAEEPGPPPPADPFAFTNIPPEPPARKNEPPAKKKEKERKPRDERADAPAPAAASDDPFAFTDAPAEPKKTERKPRGKDDTPAPADLPDAAAGDPFAFTSAPPEPPAKKKERKPRDGRADAPAPAPAAASGDPFAFTDAPAEPKEPERKPRDEADEAPPAPAPAASGAPFAFGSAPAPALAEKAERRPRDDADDRKKPAARKAPAGGGGIGLVKVIVGATVFAVVTGGIVVGALVVLNNNKPGEVVKNEKKVEPPSNEPAVVPADAPAPAGKADATPKDQAKTNPRTTAGTPQKGGAKGKGGAPALPPGKVLTFPPKPAAPKLVTEPASNPVPVAVPFADARRFFPPDKADGDIGVLWRSAAGFQGVGEKVTLTLFSPNSGKETAKVEVDHDGTPDPAADLSVDGGTFAIGHRTTGKVTVWDVRKKAKKLDAFDPYADKPEHKAAKLAAVYLTEPPDRVVTVTTAGAVHVWDVATKALAGEYVPAKAAPNKVVGGRGVAPFPTRRGVVVAVGGTIYKVDTAGTVAGTEAEDLGGDVGRSLALAVSAGGKVLYAFETDADGKREKVLMQLASGTRGPAFRWPADAGEPVAAAWAGDNVASLATSQGAAVWFDADGGFNPIAVARTPDDKAVHAVAGTDNHWSLLPAPGDTKGSVVVELALPPQGVGDPLTPAARRPTASLVLDLKGLSQEPPAAKQ